MHSYDPAVEAVEKELQSQLPVGSVWEHYRSSSQHPKHYKIIGFCRSEIDTSLHVLYQPLYDGEFPKNIPWSRNAKLFLTPIKNENGKSIPRYKKISP